ncbi:acyl-CoA dehydrogenase family protein [Frankia sp. AgB1.9]|uniref:acyl-CoA dehydrogenase family protein n=1 Tax=unclassified Frankia TaxID=2632575 RepID=UPI0019320FF0|nr:MULTISPECIES: acyl-CoA dehydrogenase family protein [unclassified Frankia]MBL7494123.1 acyl-CoA dehydrogenase family protein [Frankia sp. AgW1.1]MBL7551096.1 acyl-CoA dehydrogenase family protein [Frankia sp. AgB1.9]MBL7624738.1 acyl-CoA dehydrogenase family protein [Frankia sp. AgB1.8]
MAVNGSTGSEDVERGVREFLRTHLPAEWVAAVGRGDTGAVGAFREQLDLSAWWVSLADAGYVTPTWPAEYGGLGASRAAGGAIGRTLSTYRVPRFTNPVGVDLVGPALLRWGTDEQKRRFLRPIARHQEIWCQLFSEPGAGSDLAGLSTKAVRDGDRWLVSGQKVWTSLAHLASHGLLLARTDPDVPKHKGITAFLLPMDQPGVTVRPLRHMAGDIEFNEVFLDDVPVEDSLRLGEVGQGWQVAVSVLLNERQATSGSGGALPGTVTGRSVEALIRRHAPVGDVGLRERLVQAFIEDKLLSLTGRRAAARRRAGGGVGPEGSVLKLLYGEHARRLQELACDLEGAGGQAWVEGDRWRQNTAWSFLRVQSKTIAGGTSEIQRNIIGERVLGLPKEPDVDRDLPWSQVRHS